MSKISKRYLGEMLGVYNMENPALYTMKRGVLWKNAFKKDMDYIGKFRKDEVELPSVIINGQFNKTKGHIHSTGHKELYHVVEGDALFFMQKGREIVTDCYAILAKKGDSVILPGDYHHITINVGEGKLKMYNWISDECKSDYSLMDKMSGGCFYFSKGEAEQGYGVVYDRNKKYKRVPLKLRMEKPLKKLPKDFNFLI